MKLNNDITPHNARQVARLLNQLLSDEFVLYTKTLNYHWNVTGVHFGPLHKLFEKQYEALQETIDAVAERIRAIGQSSFGSLEEFLTHTHLDETPGHHSAQEMIKNLLDDHETIIRMVRDMIDVVLDEYDDVGTNNFLTDLLEQHEKTAWMLRAHLEK